MLTEAAARARHQYSRTEGRSSDWASVPEVVGLGFTDEASGHDDRVGEGNERVNRAPDRDAVAFDPQGSFRALFPALHRGSGGGLIPARDFHYACVHGRLFEFSADHLVAGIETDLPELGEYHRPGPLVTAMPDRSRRAGTVSDPLVGGTPHEDQDELVEHHPLWHPWPTAAQRMLIEHDRNERFQLAPDRLDDQTGDSEHEASRRPTDSSQICDDKPRARVNATTPIGGTSYSPHIDRALRLKSQITPAFHVTDADGHGSDHLAGDATLKR